MQYSAKDLDSIVHAEPDEFLGHLESYNVS